MVCLSYDFGGSQFSRFFNPFLVSSLIFTLFFFLIFLEFQYCFLELNMVYTLFSLFFLPQFPANVVFRLWFWWIFIFLGFLTPSLPDNFCLGYDPFDCTFEFLNREDLYSFIFFNIYIYIYLFVIVFFFFIIHIVVHFNISLCYVKRRVYARMFHSHKDINTIKKSKSWRDN